MTNSSDRPWTPSAEEAEAIAKDLQEGMTSNDHDLIYYFGLDDAYEIGFETGFESGYRKAVEESYPELTS